MEAFIIIGIVAAWFSRGVISALIAKFQAHKKAQNELRTVKSELNELKKDYGSIKEHRQELHKLNRKIEQQDSIIHDIKQDVKVKQEKYEATVRQKDQLYEQLKHKNNDSLEYISALISDHLTLQYDISAEFLETKKQPAYKAQSWPTFAHLLTKKPERI